MVNLRHRRSNCDPPADVRFPAASATLAAAEGNVPDVGARHTVAWSRSPAVLSLLSGLLLWASFPPLGWWPLAWVAPVGWLMLVRPEPLPGRRPYVTLALTVFLHWLVLLQGIRLAHPALYLGWVALAAYMAVYPLLFVALARIAVHRWRLSVILAAPVVWTGLELVRGHAITGFSMALLGHTQVSWTTLLQMADVGGAYGVSFLVMLVAACMARTLPVACGQHPPTGSRWSVWPLLPALLALAGAIGYGQHQLRVSSRSPAPRQPLRVALIQGSFDTIFEFNAERERGNFLRYRELSEQAVAQHPDVQLVVWPESMFTGGAGEILVAGPIEVPADAPLLAEEYRQRVRMQALSFSYKVEDVARRLNAARGPRQNANSGGVHLVVGTDTLLLSAGDARRYNSALCIRPDGQLTGRYYKMHRVMFGEYLPWGDAFPFLYRLTPMAQGLAPGEAPQCFRVGEWRLSPSICFESTVPHLIREHVQTLRKSNRLPDLLVNVTNDGWFWGSNILDLQLACCVFRAIEHRLPMIVAANTGISAYVDSDGKVQQRGPRRRESVLYAEVKPDGRLTCYGRMGDLPAGLCASFCLALALFGLATRLSRNKAGRTGRY